MTRRSAPEGAPTVAAAKRDRGQGYSEDEADDADQVASDTGAFALLPEWVLYHPLLGDRDIRLYCVLARHADKESGECFPGRHRLAGKLACSVKSVDRSLNALIRVGAVSKRPRFYDSEDQRAQAQRSNLYVVHRVRGGVTSVAPPGHPCRHCGDSSVAPGGVTSVAQNESQSERESMNSLSGEGVSIFDALTRVLERVPRTPDERKEWERVAHDLEGAGATWQQVTWVAQAWGWLGWDYSITPHAVVKHWGVLEQEISALSGQDPELVFSP